MQLMHHPEFLDRAIARLVRAFAPERILLYGSYAKGTAHAGSDVDMLVVVAVAVEGDQDALVMHQRRARQLVADLFPRIDITLCTPEDIAQAATAPSPFLLSILESARTVYDRPGHPQAPEAGGRAIATAAPLQHVIQ